MEHVPTLENAIAKHKLNSVVEETVLTPFFRQWHFRLFVHFNNCIMVQLERYPPRQL